MAAREDILAELAGVGIPDDLIDAFLEAVDTAGYNLTPSGGGSPIEAVGDVASVEVLGLPGRPGAFAWKVEVETGKYARFIQLPNPSGAGQPIYVPISGLTDSTGVGV